MAVCGHATRDDRARPDGRQHGAPAPTRRTRLRRLRRRRGSDRRPRIGARRGRRPLARRDGRRPRAAPRTSGSWCPPRSSDRPSTALAPLLDPGDTIIDGGNSWYRDDVDRVGCPRAAGRPLPRRRHQRRRVRPRTRLLPDGRRTPSAVERLTPIFESLAPGLGETERTPGPNRRPTAPEEHGWLHCGPSGAGHFVKMVHNGIEYGLMAAYAEGLNVLAKADIGASDHADDAETAPLDAPAVLPVRPRSGAGSPRCGAVAAWSAQLAARPHRGRRSHADPELERLRRPGQRLRRGSLDGQRRDRRGRAGARCCRPPCSNGSRPAAAPTSPIKVLSAMRAGFGGHVERKDATR